MKTFLRHFWIVALVLFSCTPTPRTARLFLDLPEPYGNQAVAALESNQEEAFLHDEGSEKIISVAMGDLGSKNSAFQIDGSVCRIQINRAISPTFYFPKFTQLIFREVGHCFGMPDSSDPTDVMASVYQPADAASYERFAVQLKTARRYE